MSFEEIQQRSRELEQENPHFKAAKEKAAQAVERAQLNEAINVINELLEEVDKMPLAERFSKTRKIRENQNRGTLLLDKYEDMTEADFKRGKLTMDLKSIRQEISKAITELNDIVMDVEASKVD